MVYTALVSHNGLVRQKGSFNAARLTMKNVKFVENAETSFGTRVELCVCAEFDPQNATSVEYKSKEWLIL